VGRLGNRKLRVGSRQDALGGKEWETGRPERTFKEAKGSPWVGSGDRRFTVGRIKCNGSSQLV
jgi:hypothetical protein